MIHVILFRPEIPQNTGNIGRLCACTRTCLHLIHPIGFSLSDRYLKRSGMDYWNYLQLKQYEHWEDFMTRKEGIQRIWLLTTHAEKSYTDVSFQDGDAILFGSESKGCPEELHRQLNDFRITIPMLHPAVRSLNLSTSVGIVRYEIYRQCKL